MTRHNSPASGKRLLRGALLMFAIATYIKATNAVRKLLGKKEI